MQSVDDEWHMIFDCPMFEGFRAARRSLFSSSVAYDVAAFMRQRDQINGDFSAHIGLLA